MERAELTFRLERSRADAPRLARAADGAGSRSACTRTSTRPRSSPSTRCSSCSAASSGSHAATPSRCASVHVDLRVTQMVNHVRGVHAVLREWIAFAASLAIPGGTRCRRSPSSEPAPPSSPATSSATSCAMPELRDDTTFALMDIDADRLRTAEIVTSRLIDAHEAEVDGRSDAPTAERRSTAPTTSYVVPGRRLRAVHGHRLRGPEALRPAPDDRRHARRSAASCAACGPSRCCWTSATTWRRSAPTRCCSTTSTRWR